MGECELVRSPLAGLQTRGFNLTDAQIADYDAVYELQRDLVERRKKNLDFYDHLIFVEHPDVYTYGRKSPLPDTMTGAKQVAVERGGEATFHNVGQLVSYPILKLEESERDLHLHLRRLEACLIDVLADFGLEGERRAGATGVWIRGKQKKIASIGVAVSGWVTYHGSALNVSNDLRGFARINPCGFSSDVMTSMDAELGDRCPSMGEVKESFLRHFSVRFERLLVL